MNDIRYITTKEEAIKILRTKVDALIELQGYSPVRAVKSDLIKALLESPYDDLVDYNGDAVEWAYHIKYNFIRIPAM